VCSTWVNIRCKLPRQVGQIWVQINNLQFCRRERVGAGPRMLSDRSHGLAMDDSLPTDLPFGLPQPATLRIPGRARLRRCLSR